MKRWFCGFSSSNNSELKKLPQPQDGQILWEGANPFWACGNWAKQQIMTLFEGSVSLAIVGTCLEPYESLVELFHNAIRSKDYSRLMRLPGSYNLIVQDENDTYIFTDVAGLRSVFYTEYDSGIVYSSLGMPLKELINSEVDTVWISTFLMGVTIPSLLQNRSPYCDVKSVPPGCYLQITSGKPKCKRYWNPPQKYSSFSEATENLRQQLLTAIEGRVSLYGNISSDLSGGFDSTSLALIAAKNLAKKGQKLHTVTMKTVSAIETEDIKWAEHAASLYNNISPVMVETANLPAEYSDLDKIPLTDAPSPSMMAIGQISYLMNIVKSTKSQLHMNGSGGDEVLGCSLSYVADLLKSLQIKKFLQHSYGWSRVSLCSPLNIISNACKLSLVSYRQWLLQQTRKLTTGKLLSKSLINESWKDIMGWDVVPQVANWHTKETIDLVAKELQQWRKVAKPFAKPCGQHESTSVIYASGMLAKVVQQLADSCDANLEFPFFDSLVIEACLSAKPEERKTPFTYKRLLSKALQDDLPNSIFIRNTKGEYTRDEFSGRKEHFAAIEELLQSSILVEMGLIDIKDLNAAMQQIRMGFDTVCASFNQTLAVEIWLQRLMNAGNNFWIKGNLS